MSTEFGARAETNIDNGRAYALLHRLGLPRASSSAAPRVATLFERLDARFGDAIVATGVLGLLFALALLWTGDIAAAQWYGPLAAYFVLPGLEAMFVADRGATPGKAYKRMRVASLWSPTGAPTRTQAFVRAIILQSMALSLLWWWPLVFVYALSMFTNRDRRGPHDLLAGTVVIRQVR